MHVWTGEWDRKMVTFPQKTRREKGGKFEWTSLWGVLLHGFRQMWKSYFSFWVQFSCTWLWFIVFQAMHGWHLTFFFSLVSYGYILTCTFLSINMIILSYSTFAYANCISLYPSIFFFLKHCYIYAIDRKIVNFRWGQVNGLQFLKLE